MATGRNEGQRLLKHQQGKLELDDEGDFFCLTLNGCLHWGILWFIDAYIKNYSGKCAFPCWSSF